MDNNDILSRWIMRNMPRKPLIIRAKVEHMDGEYEGKWEYIETLYCPSCGTYLAVDEACPNNKCRQAIDWGDYPFGKGE